MFGLDFLCDNEGCRPKYVADGTGFSLLPVNGPWTSPADLSCVNSVYSLSARAVTFMLLGTYLSLGGFSALKVSSLRE